MENLSHSRHQSRSSLPKKVCNGSGGFSYGSGKTATNATTTYDDVFGGPPRFGAPTLSPRLEDYCEIFSGLNGSSRAAVSSIPVLDLPVIDDRDVYFDVRSQEFDYREVFGGFNDLDLAPSYEELVMQRSTVGDGDSSDDAWTPEEEESISGGTEQSGKIPCFSNGRDSYESIDGSTEFNISYNKASQISNRSISSGMIHVADLSAIPGYTFAVDEIDYATGASNLHKETRPSFVDKGTSRYAFEEQDSRAVRFPGEPFVTVSEIDLKTHPTGIPPPSRPPPILKSDFRNSASNSRTTGSVGSGDSNSPPFFDVEVDSSSAAVKEAMVKAEAKLKSAKELERKSNGACAGMKPSSTNNRMEEGKTSYASGLPDIEKYIDVARMGDKHGSKSVFPQGYTNCDGNDEWKEATQFVELVRTEVPRNSEENSSEKDVSLPLNTDFFNQELKWAPTVDWEKQERRAKGAREDREAKKLSKNSGRKKVASRHQRHEKNMLAEKVSEEQEDDKAGYVALHFETGSKLPDDGGIMKHRDPFREEEDNLLTEKVPKQQKEEKTKRTQNHQFDKTPHPWKAAEQNQECVFDWEQNARKLREALGLAENESTLEVSLELKGNGKSLGMDKNEKKLNEALKRVEEETRIKEARVTEENERKQREAFEKAEDAKRLKAALEQEEKEKRVKQAREKEENERRAKEALEKAERERKMKEQEELRLKEAFEKEEMKRRMREIREKEEHERKMKVALEQEKERRIKEAREKEENERRIKEAREKAELEQRLKEKLEQEEKERQIKEFQEREDNERKAKEILEQAENQRRLKEAIAQKEKEAHEKEETEKKLKEAIELEEKEKRLAEAFERAEIERRLKEDLEQEDMEMRQREAEEREESERMCREYQANDVKQHDFTREEEDETQRDVSEMEKAFETTKKAHGKQWSTECFNNTLEDNGREYNHESVHKVLEDGLGQKESRDMYDEACPWKVFEKNLKDASLKERTNELDADSESFESNEEVTQRDENGGYNQLNGESGAESTPVSEKVPGGKLEQKSNKETSVPRSETELKTGVEERSRGTVAEEDNVRKTSTVRDQRNVEESKFAPKTTFGLNQDAKFERQLPPRGVKDAIDRTRNVNDVSLQHEKEAERIKKERDFELERLRKIEEEREREREREKDRMAFDQRALADARERLEKACAEARERSLPDKSSMEARLRSERAAVERATSEARERAVEKAAFEARERMERSVSDKHFQNSGFFGEKMERSVSDKHFQTSRYQSGADAESPQRYTSRLERHRRTADRVAKALAEKNMRDLVAQREQTERTRISETLDADVKRWSNGKEGNIRALLSTLQYILGSESGWQPIPLTEVITSAAVKRAYRKATLCVHPDKLQQRGATIHQKYISEKVFDLLKEAWNRFNSEER